MHFHQHTARLRAQIVTAYCKEQGLLTDDPKGLKTSVNNVMDALMDTKIMKVKHEDTENLVNSIYSHKDGNWPIIAEQYWSAYYNLYQLTYSPDPKGHMGDEKTVALYKAKGEKLEDFVTYFNKKNDEAMERTRIELNANLTSDNDSEGKKFSETLV